MLRQRPGMDVQPLPDHLVRGAHRHGALRTAGITRREIDGPLWRRTTHGLYAFGPSPPATALQRVQEAAAALPPGGVLGGWAAAFLWGAVDLDGEDGAGRPHPVPLALPPEAQVRRGSGFRTWRSRLAAADVGVVDGMPVTSPVRTAFDLARFQPLEDGMVAVDALLRCVDLRTLERYVRAHPRWKGVPRARAVLELADPAARSCPESRFRYVWVVEAGLPRPRVNIRVVTADAVLLGLPDLLDEDSGLVGEYDGGHHRELDAHTADNVREEAMEQAGLVVVRATSVDLRRAERPALVQRLRAGLDRARLVPVECRGWRVAARPAA